MIFSSKYAHLALRIGLAAVFFWLGVGALLHPQPLLGSWVATTQLSVIKGIFEVLVGISLLIGVFMRFFSLVGIFLLALTDARGGASDLVIRDAGLVGSLLAIVLWPEYGKR